MILNPQLTVYNTGNGAFLQKLPEKFNSITNFKKKIVDIIVENEKKENKTLILFRNYSSRLARALSSVQSEQSGLE